jgi:ribosomal protein S18 acetylase RimI-like enzyme
MSATATTEGDAWPVRVLGPTDLGAAAALALEAGWNQVEADWRIFLELGHVMGVDIPGRGVVATAATLPLGADLGWIGMMLVGTPYRRQGIGRQLLGQCILDLAAQGLTPGLDATAAGRELYQRYDFQDTWAISRWRRERAAAAPTPPEAALEVRAATVADLEPITALDRRAFGYERRGVLARLLERAPRLAALALRRGEPCGFLLARDGREALQLGPLVATDAAAPAALIAHAAARVSDAAYLDLLDRHQDLRGWLATHGFAPQRRFTRMLYRRDDPAGDARLAFAIAGPELG